jgi:hypothetical protein
VILGISDHNLIHVVRKSNSVAKTHSHKSVRVRNFKNFNTNSFQEDLVNEPWHQPRSQGICFWEAKTLVDAGHVTHRKLIASEEDRKVSYYMFPLPHFTLRLQGVAVLYNNL